MAFVAESRSLTFLVQRRVNIFKYIAETIDISQTKPNAFNIIVAGCGAGKSYFVKHHLHEYYKDVDPQDILIVTSRALTRDQQADGETLRKFNKKILSYWNGDVDDYGSTGASISCYGDIIEAARSGVLSGHLPLERVKIIVFDECHALFSDEFIDDMRWLRACIVQWLNSGQKIIYGLTATPGIVDYWVQRGQWGAVIHKMTKESISGYKANQMICTDFDTIPYLIATDKLPGKTIILCPSVADCYKLKDKIVNSAVMVSHYNKKHCTPEMDAIRDFIKLYESLPDTYYESDANGNLIRRDLDVLICTSTAREGFNLQEKSGVRNVICCMTDELHVVQFAGRCRYNLDNIVVAQTHVKADSIPNNQDEYILHSRKLFSDYMRDRDSIKWFESVAHLINHDVYGIKRFVLGSNASEFINFINAKWLVPSDVSDEEKRKYRIYKQEDKDEIVTKAAQTKLVDTKYRELTFARVIEVLKECLGYVIEDGRARMDGKNSRYKLIVSFDEDSVSYNPAKLAIND